jgi:hypothetical protein
MNQTPLTYLKFGLITVALIGGFVLVGTGKLDAATMYQQSATLIAALVVALGLTSAGTQVASMVRAHTLAMVARADAESAPDAVKRGATRGFVTVRSLAMMAGAGLIIVGAIFGLAEMMGCTKAEGTEVETVGENVSICALGVVATDIANGITDPGQWATDAAAKCLGANATDAQKAGLLRVIDASAALRAARATDGGR